MTFPNHGIARAIIHGFIGWLIWDNPIFITIFATSGFFFGVLPDLLSWVERTFSPDNPDHNWQFYNEVHSGWINKVCNIIPAWGYHTWIDSKIHPYPDHKMKYRIIEAIHWIAYIGLALWLWVF